jgi:hypothetical protein
MYHKEDPRIWIFSTDEPAPDCDATKDEMGQGEESIKQCVLLVLYDLRVEHDMLLVCTMLRHCLRRFRDTHTFNRLSSII